MNKKDLKMYVAPFTEVVEADLEGELMSGSGKIGGGGQWHSRENDDIEFEEED